MIDASYIHVGWSILTSNYQRCLTSLSNSLVAISRMPSFLFFFFPFCGAEIDSVSVWDKTRDQMSVGWNLSVCVPHWQMSNKPAGPASETAACVLSSCWSSAAAATLFLLAFLGGGWSSVASVWRAELMMDDVFFRGCGDDDGCSRELGDLIFLPSLPGDSSSWSRLRVSRGSVRWGMGEDFFFSFDFLWEDEFGRDEVWGAGESSGVLSFCGDTIVCGSSVSELSAGRGRVSVGGSKQGPSGWGDLEVSASTWSPLVLSSGCLSVCVSTCSVSSEGPMDAWASTSSGLAFSADVDRSSICRDNTPAQSHWVLHHKQTCF